MKGKKQKLRCYTRKQLRAIHPAGYVLKGECLAAEVSAEDEPVLSPPKTYSRWKYKAFTSFTFDAVDSRPLYIAVAQPDWETAPAGDYTDMITFTVTYHPAASAP